MESTVQTAVQSTKVDILVHSSGYVPPEYPKTPDDLLALARIFPAKVAETGQGVPFAIDLMEYRFLNDLPLGPNLFDLQNRDEVIQYAANVKAQAMTRRATVEFILANQDIYPSANQPELQKHVHDVNALLDRLHKAMSNCFNDPMSCGFSREDLVLPPITLPPAVTRALPKNLRAMVVWPNNNMYFFQGEQYFRYIMDPTLEGVAPGYPLLIRGNWRGLGEAFPLGIDAGVVWPNGKAYFFKGDRYVRYTMDPAKEGVEPGYPQPIKGNWPGLADAFPSGIDAALVWQNKKAYFFKDEKYVEYEMDPARKPSSRVIRKPSKKAGPAWPKSFLSASRRQ